MDFDSVDLLKDVLFIIGVGIIIAIAAGSFHGR